MQMIVAYNDFPPVGLAFVFGLQIGEFGVCGLLGGIHLLG
jgi:hypothetical protein